MEVELASGVSGGESLSVGECQFISRAASVIEGMYDTIEIGLVVVRARGGVCRSSLENGNEDCHEKNVFFVGELKSCFMTQIIVAGDCQADKRDPGKTQNSTTHASHSIVAAESST